ncbi:MAG: PHP domain-containing protein [Gemmatimonadetes bacterium]|nr:PHP domain-containing protein [Gemmatimonadota bacterium]
MLSDRFADLQLHSTASDGSDAPSEVVRRAHQLGFTAIALTDHDTLGGWPRRWRRHRRLGIEVIPACEISTLDDNERQVDMLGFGIASTMPRSLTCSTRCATDGSPRAWGWCRSSTNSATRSPSTAWSRLPAAPTISVDRTWPRRWSRRGSSPT